MTFADADFGFHPEAQAEFVADVEWFEGRESGLGERFDGAVRSAIQDAVLSPEAWPKWQGDGSASRPSDHEPSTSFPIGSCTSWRTSW